MWEQTTFVDPKNRRTIFIHVGTMPVGVHIILNVFSGNAFYDPIIPF